MKNINILTSNLTQYSNKKLVQEIFSILKNSLAFFLLLCCLSACKHNHDEHDHKEDHGAMEENHEHHDEEDSKTRLTKKQIETIELEFGSFSKIKINDFIQATGTLGLPPNASAYVNAKSEGYIRGANKYVEGDKIERGTIICYLENPIFIHQQEAFLSLKTELKFLDLDLKRQQSLVNSGAGVPKKLELVQKEIAIKNVKMAGLKKQLEYVGINTELLTTNNIQNNVIMRAPISGYIASIELHNGEYVEPQKKLLEIVNEQHLHLELDVFEKDVSKIKKGQKISYSIPAYGNQNYEAEISVIGREFDKENKTVRIHCHLEGKKPKFIKDLFVTSKIWLNDQTVQSLPEGAIIQDGGSSFIYVAQPSKNEQYEFEKIAIIPGVSENGYTALKLIDSIPNGHLIVTKNAYYVFAKSQAGKLKHEH